MAWAFGPRSEFSAVDNIKSNDQQIVEIARILHEALKHGAHEAYIGAFDPFDTVIIDGRFRLFKVAERLSAKLCPR